MGLKNPEKQNFALTFSRNCAAADCIRQPLKSSNHKQMHLSDTDTGQMLEVCDTVAAAFGEESSLMRRGKPDHAHMFKSLQSDLVIMEGGRSLFWLPRIVILRTLDDAELLLQGITLATWGPVRVAGIPAVERIEDLADLVLERGFALPGLDCGLCGRESCHELAREIVSGTAEPKDCLASTPKLEIRVDGQLLAMNGFVQRIFMGALTGMLKECKGYGPGRLEISVDQWTPPLALQDYLELSRMTRSAQDAFIRRAGATRP